MSGHGATASAPRWALAPHIQRRTGLWVGDMVRVLALVGGGVLVALAALTVISVTGRAFVKFGLGPIPGDFELVEAGCAFAVFTFLPWCQFRRGHVTVDIFVVWLPSRVRIALSLTGNTLMTVVSTLIALRLQEGLIDKFSYDETTFILEMPVWYGYAATLVGAWSFALVCLYTVWRSWNELAAGDEHGIPGQGSERPKDPAGEGAA